MFKSKLNEISIRRYKSGEPKRALGYIKLLYESRETFIKLSNVSFQLWLRFNTNQFIDKGSKYFSSTNASKIAKTTRTSKRSKYI